jgi:hypothetical protein
MNPSHLPGFGSGTAGTASSKAVPPSQYDTGIRPRTKSRPASVSDAETPCRGPHEAKPGNPIRVTHRAKGGNRSQRQTLPTSHAVVASPEASLFASAKLCRCHFSAVDPSLLRRKGQFSRMNSPAWCQQAVASRTAPPAPALHTPHPVGNRPAQGRPARPYTLRMVGGSSMQSAHRPGARPLPTLSGHQPWQCGAGGTPLPTPEVP